MPRAFAERVSVPAWRATPILASVPNDVAVALMVQRTTAHYLVTDSFKLDDAALAHVDVVRQGSGATARGLGDSSTFEGSRMS
jgi:hypothetical protein